MPRIIITGATGFIGSHIAAECLRRKASVICLRRPSALPSDIPGAAWLTYDKWSHSGESADAIIHAAAVRHRHGIADQVYIDQNTRLTSFMVEGAKKLLSPSGRFVDISSVSVFGFSPDLPMSDESPFAPANAYGQSKCLCEELLRQSELPYAIVRPTITYGPGDTNGMMDKLFRLLKAGKYRLIGDGSVLTQIAYVEDFAFAAVEAALRPGLNGAEFLCTTPEPISFAKLSHLSAGLLGTKLPKPNLPVWFAKLAATGFETLEALGLYRGEPPVTHEKLKTVLIPCSYSIARMQKILQWTPPTSYEEGLRKTVLAWKG